MMNRSFKHLCLMFITIQLFFGYGQTQIKPWNEGDELGMDEGLLTISSTLNSDHIWFTYNMVICERCSFDNISDMIRPHSNVTVKINTRYPYDFQLHKDFINGTPICQIDAYNFDEHGGYKFTITSTDTDETSCEIVQTKDPGYYWTPVICAILFLCCFILIVQLCQHIYNSRYIGRILTNIGHERLINNEIDETSTARASTIDIRRASLLTTEPLTEDILGLGSPPNELPLVGSTRSSNNSVRITKVLPKRLLGLDTFRGFALMIMIFVNYGGGGYWFFNHSVWNGLTLADLVFPWFVWMMGLSIVLSQRSLLKKKMSKTNIFFKICRRTVILFLLGLLLQGGYTKPKEVRILGVLQRLAACYFFTATLVLIFAEAEDDSQSSQWPIGDDVHQPLKEELHSTVFNFWPEWLFIFGVTLVWTLVTLLPKIGDCPRGYLGPGGKHEYGKYVNCTGGTAGYLDRKILGTTHMYGDPTCRDVYNTQVPYDPEGLLGILSGILLCYLGVQAGHSFVYSTRVRRVCTQWIISGLICGFLGLLLSKGGQSDSWIPINKNMWSLSFIFVLASLAFAILTIFYLVVDVYKVFTGAPLIWLGMNSIVVFCGHEICGSRFPIQFVVKDTHAEKLTLHIYGVMWWFLISGVMYYKKAFISV